MQRGNVIRRPEPFDNPHEAAIFSNALGFRVNYHFLIPETQAQDAPWQEIMP